MESKLTALKQNSKIDNKESKKVRDLKIVQPLDYNTLISNNRKYKESKRETTENYETIDNNPLIYKTTGRLINEKTEKESQNNDDIKSNKRLMTLVNEDNSSEYIENHMTININKNNETESENVSSKSEENSQKQNKANLIEVRHSRNLTDNNIEMLNYYQTTNNCLICEKIAMSHDIYTTGKCAHNICKKCIKRYYEEKIEEGDFSFKCPIYFCDHTFSLQIIKHFITVQHYKVIVGEKSQLITIKEELNINSNASSGQETLTHMKFYSKKNVVDIGTNEKFFYYNKCKDYICKYCNEPALFGKNGTHFIKCLNCFKCICKHCLKKYDDGHMDISNNNHCKVYYRREDEEDIQDRKKNQISFFMKFLESLVLIIIGFLSIFFADFCYFYSLFNYIFSCGFIKKQRLCYIKFFSYLFSIIFFLFTFPILFLLFPFFPVFSLIFG